MVLAVISREDTYGYKITQDIQSAAGVSESTLYPVLRRLQKDDCLDVYDKAFMGRNRRYYRITPKGMAVLGLNREEWILHRKKVEGILFENSEAAKGRSV
ncbi:MAG: PadR family transcriptional regulator [Oscillospiraceae bacterium]